MKLFLAHAEKTPRSPAFLGLYSTIQPAFVGEVNILNDQKNEPSRPSPHYTGYELRCHCCGDLLPLLHPHIMVERYDEDENIICEDCYEKKQAAAHRRPIEK
jgi:hypothetical protein